MTAVGRSASTSSQDLLMATARRREIIGQFALIEKHLHQQQMKDQMSKNIAEFCGRFIELVRNNNDHEAIFGVFINVMKDILKDPFGIPLDEESRLGSDGEVYGNMSLCVYLSSAPESHRNKSPSNPDDPTKFTVSRQPHSNVRFILQILEKYGSKIKDVELQEVYEQLKIVGLPKLPFILTPDEERIERIIERQERKDREKAEEQQKYKNSLNQELKNHIAALFNVQREKLQQEQKQNIDKGKKLVTDWSKKQTVRLQQIEGAIKNLEKEIEDLKKENEKLKEDLQKLSNEISEAEWHEKDLRRQLNEVEIALKERKSSWLGKVCTIAACAIASYGLSIYFQTPIVVRPL